jgi:integration host factor subunit alpha
MGNTVTKADIIERINQRIGYSKKESAEIIESLLESIKDRLGNGEKVKISGFGNFEVRAKNPRIGRNPQTKEEIEISARRVLTFKPSQVVKKLMNDGELPADQDDDDTDFTGNGETPEPIG